ncbi:uncharacterized protein BT62DRAFT_935544 [Guyanagaster necrorhizus]|uniref:DUF6593 domain-containing protein n=1 Tax=Guyanagaster necrorhizus TaxID=856835 RepID=A0A9P7VLN4_9AGAR|nr:uncharacterized protein BT62DRAFT_935544 [Guyanagaster necrorhizus MCA 3950]KAG7442810.1 hypothetical protein BT62DRAFT_935544 [Guyanagaster necrorhizus MCA 3950]
MDFSLLENSLSNTVLVLPDGTPAYHIDTPFKWFGATTTIKKIIGSTSSDMAVIQINGWDASVVQVWGRDVCPQRTGIFSTSESWVGADNQPYKWKLDMGELYLVKNDGSHALIANFDNGSIGIFSKPRPPKLTITPEGLAIADEIVATFIYMGQKRERRRRHNNM